MHKRRVEVLNAKTPLPGAEFKFGIDACCTTCLPNLGPMAVEPHYGQISEALPEAQRTQHLALNVLNCSIRSQP